MLALTTPSDIGMGLEVKDFFSVVSFLLRVNHSYLNNRNYLVLTFITQTCPCIRQRFLKDVSVNLCIKVQCHRAGLEVNKSKHQLEVYVPLRTLSLVHILKANENEKNIDDRLFRNINAK